MAEATTPHPFMPVRKPDGDPNICGFPGCAKVWNSIDHQPSRYLAPYKEAISEAVSRLSEGAGVPPALLHTERASGAPSDGAPATHTGRPAMHSGIPHPMFATLGQPGKGKMVINPGMSMMADAMRFAQELEATGLKKLATVQDSEVWEVPTEMRAKEAQEALAKLTAGTELMSEDHCDHPNGFGPNGCPCGASAPDEDAEFTFRHIDTGKDERGVRCPVTLDCMHGVWPESKIREHVVGEHGWSGDRFESWAESVNLQDLPLIPAPLVEDMAERQARQAEVDAFLDPSITVEDMMAVADRGLGAVVTEWWLKRAEEEAESVIPKAVAYGSNSLMQLGRKMGQMQGREVSDEEALELGCWINTVQKIERWTDSVMRGERCSDDTIYDAGVYLRMVQRIRDVGSWPGV